MKHLFAIASLMNVSVPVQAETVYLLIKPESYKLNTSIHSIPMDSHEQCEEAGAVIVGSSRFDTKHSTKEEFECVIGK